MVAARARSPTRKGIQRPNRPAGTLTAILAGLGIAVATSSQVGVQIFQFRPGQLEVKAGTRVTWTNQDDITHTVTSGTPEQRDGRFDQRLEGRGAATTVEFTPDRRVTGNPLGVGGAQL